MNRSDARIDPNEVIGMLKDLVSIKSINPYVDGGPGEVEMADYIVKKLESFGLEVRMQDVADGRFNVIGTLKGEGKGGSLILNGHMDTVGVSGMTIDPFRPFIDEAGRLHGRGACDMKGSLAAMMGAIKGIIDSDIKLRGDLIFAGVVDEEYMSAGAKRLIEEYTAHSAIIGEPTSLQIAIAHKGFVWLEVETKGKPAHGSVPEHGIDAIAKMGKFISRLASLEEAYSKKIHPLLGTPKLHASTIQGGTEWSVIPESCVLRLERRTIPGEDEKTALAELQLAIDELSREDLNFRAAVRKVFEAKGMEVPADEAIVKCLHEATLKVKGSMPNLIGVPYWTDASILVNDAKIPTCIFGPGDICLAHSADEYVPIDEVLEAAKIYALTAQLFCGTS